MNRTTTQIIAVVVITLATVESSFAQTNSRGNIARIVFHQDVAEEPKQDLEGALNALRQETRQLRSTTKNTTPGVATSKGPAAFPVERPSTRTALPELRPDSEQAAIDGIGNTSDIVERIELLKRIYEKKRIENANRTMLKAQTPPEVAQPLTNDSAEPEGNPVPQAVERQMPPQNAAPKGPPVAQVASRVTEQPVDLFEMGNSLYQTGEIETALEAYKQVEPSSISASEAVWLDFMTASCHRRLGNSEAAITLYREVANQNEAPNLTKPAMRWLKQLDYVTQSMSSIKSMESKINSLIETAKSHVKQ